MPAGDLPRVAVPEIVLEHPPNADLGDFASHVAMRCRGRLGGRRSRWPGAITAHLEPDARVSAVETPGPGFINFFLADEWLQEQVDAILEDGTSFGGLPLGRGERVQVEIVSANPTGPLHVGAARNAALGDTLAQRPGSDAVTTVQREYYVNDAGSQIEALGASVWPATARRTARTNRAAGRRLRGRVRPSWPGRSSRWHGDSLLSLPREQADGRAGPMVDQLVLRWIERDLADMGVEFDRWYSERTLYEGGLFEKTIGLLREQRSRRGARGRGLVRLDRIWATTATTC